MSTTLSLTNGEKVSSLGKLTSTEVAVLAARLADATPQLSPAVGNRILAYLRDAVRFLTPQKEERKAKGPEEMYMDLIRDEVILKVIDKKGNFQNEQRFSNLDEAKSEIIKALKNSNVASIFVGANNEIYEDVINFLRVVAGNNLRSYGSSTNSKHAMVAEINLVPADQIRHNNREIGQRLLERIKNPPQVVIWTQSHRGKLDRPYVFYSFAEAVKSIRAALKNGHVKEFSFACKKGNALKQLEDRLSEFVGDKAVEVSSKDRGQGRMYKFKFTQE